AEPAPPFRPRRARRRSACRRCATRSARAPRGAPRRAWPDAAAGARDRPAQRRATLGRRPSRARPPRRSPRDRRPPRRPAAPRSPGSGRRSPATFVSICARFGDERLEEPLILGRFRMPEDTEREALPGILDCLHRAVVGPGRLAQPAADAAGTLVMVRLDRRVPAEHRPEPRAVVDRDAVLGERAFHL